MLCAIYARISTRDKGQDPELQLKPMREYCRRMGWSFEEYTDQLSGSKERRPALDEMLTRLKHKEFDVLMVWKLDRLARSLKHLIDFVYGELHPRNIDFICLTQQMDTTTPTGRLLFGVLGSLAEFEHDLIAERVKEGMANAKSKGLPIGRKRAIEIHTPTGKAMLERLLDAYQEQKTVRGAARKVGMPPGTAHHYLKEAGVI